MLSKSGTFLAGLSMHPVENFLMKISWNVLSQQPKTVLRSLGITRAKSVFSAWVQMTGKKDFEAQYRHFVDRLLQVEHTAVLVTSLIPRENTDMSIPNKMLEKMVQSYKAQNAKVGYVKTLKSALSPGNGNP